MFSEISFFTRLISHFLSSSALAPTKTDADVLDPDEIEKLINAHSKVSHKALVETFFVTGTRTDRRQWTLER